MNRIEKLREKLKGLYAKAREIVDLAETEDRDLTEDELTEVNDLTAQSGQVRSQIETLERLEAEGLTLETTSGRQTQADDPRVEVGQDRQIDADPKQGFASYGAFAQAVQRASQRGARADDRLIKIQAAAATTYGSEGVGEDGGFLVPPEFSNDINSHALGGDAFLPLTDNTVLTLSNSMTFPTDETTPWGTDGIRVFWAAEASQATETKPKIGTRSLRLHKLIGLVPVTDELLADTRALETYITRKTGENMRWKQNDALVNGSGAGQPLGIANSPALVSVAKEGAQAADTIVAENIAKMFSRMPPSAISRAVWLINNDAFPQLITMTLGNTPIFTPPGDSAPAGITSAPAGRLLGRPLVMSQSCQTLGDKGDIYFVDWLAYRTITKAGGMQTATSIHLYFDYDETAFRATYRLDGQPWMNAPITPARGTANLSNFVTLDERA